MSFREELKKCRKEHNLSQEELAKNISVSVKDIEKWENALGLPSEENVDALANYFGKSKENFTPTAEEEELVEKRRKAAKRIRIFQIVGYCLLLSFLGICLFLVILHSKKSYLFESDRVLWIDDYYVFVEEKVFVKYKDGDERIAELHLSPKEAEELKKTESYDYMINDVSNIHINKRFWFFADLGEVDVNYVGLYDHKSETESLSAGALIWLKDHNGTYHYIYKKYANVTLGPGFTITQSEVPYLNNTYVTINGKDIELEHNYYFTSDVLVTAEGVDFKLNGSKMYFSK